MLSKVLIFNNISNIKSNNKLIKKFIESKTRKLLKFQKLFKSRKLAKSQNLLKHKNLSKFNTKETRPKLLVFGIKKVFNCL